MMRFLMMLGVVAMLGLGGCVAATSKADDDKHQADVHYKLAVAQLQASNPTAALRELLRAVELDPKNSSIRVALAQAYQQRRAYPESEKQYLEALALSGNDPRYQNNIASLYLDMGQWDKAIGYFEQAAGNLLFDSPQVAMTGMGYAYLQKQDYDTALKTFREVSALYPNYAPAFYYQAEVYRLTADERLEKVALQRTVDLAPDFIQARYRLAVQLVKEKNHAQARQQLKTIINFAPESDEGRNAVELIKTLP